MTEYTAKKVILKDAIGNYLIPFTESELPKQTNNVGKFLATDGSNASWEYTYTPHLLEFKWSDHIIDDISWLRADLFSWHSGDTYSAVYSELLSEYNNENSILNTENGITYKVTPKGYKIALQTEEDAIANKYNNTGIAWYYILDTTNTQFKLPRTKFGFQGLRDVVGKDILAGLPDHRHFEFVNGSGTASDARANQLTSDQYVSSWWYSGYAAYVLARIGGNPDVGLSGGVTDKSIYSKSGTVQMPGSQMYLYFYVGKFTQTAVENTAGINSELINSKVDISSLVEIVPLIKSYTQGTSGYDIWANGRCRQWGTIPFGATGGWVSGDITFLKKYKDINYSLLGRGNWSDASASDFRVNSMSVTGFNVTVAINTYTSHNGQWEAYGTLADGEY